MAINRRLIFWLIRAYVQKWGKAILGFFVLGLLVFFLLQTFLISFITKITSENKEVIGIDGTYTIDSLPLPILQLVSRGLTYVTPDGLPHPDAASSWQITDNGKTYIFHIKPGITFSDGTPLTSKDVNYNFSDVQVSRPDTSTIVYRLSEPYAPFLLSVSTPIFKNDFIGIGAYTVRAVSQNTGFIDSLTLVDRKNSGIQKVYQFYPTDDALKLAFALGEVSIAQNVNNLNFQKSSLATFANATITKSTDYQTLVTLFYNTTDKVLSDEGLRDALSYTMPDTFAEGVRAYSPLSPLSWAYQNTNQHTQDFAHAKLLLEASFGTNPKEYPTLTISTLMKYMHIAKIVQANFAKIGIKSTIMVVNTVPSTFQVYLGDFQVPQDPDQYTLWHSYADNNITNYNKDVRIDKLLEDGRKTLDQSTRASIYADFQKYLINAQPATFLYFPYLYTVTRK